MNIVFFIYVDHPDHWVNTVQEQINDIKVCGILQVSDLYICLSGSQQNMDLARTYINGQFKETACHIDYSYTTQNLFEYPAIHKLYSLAQTNQNKIFLYLHTKDVTHLGADYKRSVLNKSLTRWTLWNYRKVLRVFEKNPHINKIGLFPNHETGWIWYNLFWVRGSFLSIANEPIISSNRWYYESWLYTANPSLSMTCFSIYSNKEEYFTQKRTVLLSHEIIKDTTYLIMESPIDKVTYGFKKKTVDVTKVVMNWLENDVCIHVCNKFLGCDPCFGVVKELCFYFRNGNKNTFREGTNLLVTVFPNAKV